MTAGPFDPLLDMARLRRLEAVAAQHTREADPAHDFLHVQRVMALTSRIAAAEGADLAVTMLAALLHELFNYPKDHPQSHLSGEVCAQKAVSVLRREGLPPEFCERVAYCIRVHSFSRGIVPETLEARVLQDADRLDALGAIGIARCFATGSSMRRPFYAPEDPFCHQREPDDKQWSLDHFYKKLLKLPSTLHTATARQMAGERAIFLQDFLGQLEKELMQGG